MSDKSEILSEAEVDFLLTADKSDPAPTPEPAGTEEQAVTMRGDLEQINLADIFQTLGMSKMEGVLRIRNPLEERQVYCRDGYLRVHVPGRLATRRLGQRLVHAGLVQGDQLRSALLAQRKDKKPLGQLLIAEGLVSQEAIDEIVANQVAEDLFALFTWRHGTFEFWKGEPSAALKETFQSCPEYEVNSLLLEVARRSDEWESILAAVSSLDEVPMRLRECEPGEEEQLGELHRELLPNCRGHESYRELADRTTHGLFEVARAARDLVRSNILGNIDDAAMVAVAQNHAEMGNAKRALVVLQTLRDRPGDRPMGILQTMAKALERAGERRLAGGLMLEAAQRHTDPVVALELARSARTMLPHDVGTLSFLRTVLVAYAPADSGELEKVTLDLLDAMLEADLLPTALEIIEDARRTGTTQPAILMREVRARQKGRDIAGATKVLEELAKLYDQQGQGEQANETYAALLRLDRSRRDIQKLLTIRRRTRLGRIVRIVAAATIALMVAGMGIVFWQQREFSQAVASADREITTQLEAGNPVEARNRLESWASKLGQCESIEDLQSRVAFAEAAEQVRQQKARRALVARRLAEAAEQLDKGGLATAMSIYAELASDDKVRGEVADIVQTRVAALLDEIGQAIKGLQARTPPDPTSLIDRQDLLTGQADLTSICRPALLDVFEQLEALVQVPQPPALFAGPLLERIHQVLAEGKKPFAMAKALAGNYGAALARNDQHRQLDPLFKAAVESERNHDFAKALAHYLELERQPANDGDLRAHFRDRVARNATIVRLLEALHAATTAGDFATAQQQLRALRISFPDVPFDQIAQLPLRVESRPPGARVLCDGKDVGATPMVLSRLPADHVRLSLQVEGLRSAETTVTGDEPGAWFAHLTLPPTRSWQHDSALEVAPAPTATCTIVVDRAGNVVARAPDGSARWTFRSGDLSGLLTPPCVRGNTVFFGSLDGDLRALDVTTGDLSWSMPDLATEVAPLLVDRVLLVASTDHRLHSVDVDRRFRSAMELPDGCVAILRGPGNVAYVLGAHGHLQAVDVEKWRVLWRRELATSNAPQACVVQGTLVVADERGQAVGVDAATGEVRWQRDLRGETLGAPVAADSNVWIPTRTHLHQLAAVSGQVRAAVAPDEHEWTGPAIAHGDRLAVPIRAGIQVCDLASGQLLYRLTASKRARMYAVGSELWLVEADHTIHAFSRLR